MQEGARIHRQLQQQYKEQDEKELFLRQIFFLQELQFIIEGRCDGLIKLEDGWLIDEIKSTSRQIQELEDGAKVHWAQARLYGYMVAEEKQLEGIYIQLSYVASKSGEVRTFREYKKRAELEQFTYQVLEAYTPYARCRAAHRNGRDASIQQLGFPFERYREGQRKLAGAVYQTIREEKKLFAKAPTGIGKSISTLFPAVKAIGEGLLQQVFYLTARTTTRTAAEQALDAMHKSGLQLQSVTITAKDKICFQDENLCSKEECPYANGYYDRINGALLDMLTHEQRMDRHVIEQYARKHTVCPFEMSLDAAYTADVVIADYNYIFDPRISLKRLAGEQRKKMALLVDEAHNLVDRGREMFSASVQKEDFLALSRGYKGLDAAVYHTSHAVNKEFIAIRKKSEENGQLSWSELPEQLAALIEEFTASAELRLASGTNGAADPQLHQLLLDTYFKASQFVRIAKLYGKQYVTYADIYRSGMTVKLFCMTPAELLKQAVKGIRSVIFFSATLSPLLYYRDMFGADEEDYSLSIPSPFRREQLEVRIVPLSTRYRDRAETIEELIELLAGLPLRKKGNYLFFFPSYQYLSAVHELLPGRLPSDTQLIVQSGGMTEQERELFLDAFQAGGEHTLIGLAVLGGVFSEGIDLQGDRLNGVAVVGVGLPQHDLERELIKAHFQKEGKNGYHYAYIYPGMNKVLQAGGRLIRSEEDEGMLLLIDDRFLQSSYYQLLPEEWK